MPPKKREIPEEEEGELDQPYQPKPWVEEPWPWPHPPMTPQKSPERELEPQLVPELA